MNHYMSEEEIQRRMQAFAFRCLVEGIDEAIDTLERLRDVFKNPELLKKCLELSSSETKAGGDESR